VTDANRFQTDILSQRLSAEQPLRTTAPPRTQSPWAEPTMNLIFHVNFSLNQHKLIDNLPTIPEKVSMKRPILKLAAICSLAFTLNSSAVVLYVDLNSTNPIPLYADWSTAATTIQDAVDAANPGDTVLVTNGVYQTGGRVVYGTLTNLVVINKAITVRSVNGPVGTTIQAGGISYSDSAARCVYLTNGVMLAGFTITNGSTRAVSWPTPTPENCGGGVWCESVSAVISNCVLVGNTAYFDGGGAYGGTLVNCTLANNSSSGGGGAYSGTLTNCTLIGNSASVGGGAYQCILDTCTINQNSTSSGGGGVLECTLNHCALLNNVAGSGGGACSSVLTNCTLSGNTVLAYGGGAAWGTLVNCTITGNTVNMTNYGCGPISGGGAYGATLNNCVISGNQVINSLMGNSKTYGGGASGGVLNNCLVTGNSCWNGGSGAYNATLNNCTVVGNSDQPIVGGAAYNCTVNNSIVRFNTFVNYAGSSLNYCCTTPLPAGNGNFVTDPLFVNRAGGDYHLQASSLCINSGNNSYVNGSTDLDGKLRISGGIVDIGAYEFQNPASIISYAWLQQYGLLINTNTDTADPDGDGMNNWQEWKTGTNPTNSSLVLKMASASATNNPPGLVVTWQSVSGINYFIQSGTNLGAPPAFSTIQTNIAGQAGTTSFTDTNAVGSGPYFYRVGVQ
jgi:hypothetical protein